VNTIPVLTVLVMLLAMIPLAMHRSSNVGAAYRSQLLCFGTVSVVSAVLAVLNADLNSIFNVMNAGIFAALAINARGRLRPRM
jgi:hypothetical protein